MVPQLLELRTDTLMDRQRFASILRGLVKVLQTEMDFRFATQISARFEPES